MQRLSLTLCLIFATQNILAETSNITYNLNIINLYQNQELNQVQDQNKTPNHMFSKEEIEHVVDKVIQANAQYINQSAKSEMDQKYEKHLDAYNELADQELQKRKIADQSGAFTAGAIFATVIIVALLLKFAD